VEKFPDEKEKFLFLKYTIRNNKQKTRSNSLSDAIISILSLLCRINSHIFMRYSAFTIYLFKLRNVALKFAVT